MTDDDIGPGGDAIGQAIYLETSLSKYGCWSNATGIFRGSKIEIRAARDIHENEEVIQPYAIFFELDREGARKHFKEMFHVDCQCRFCSLPPQKDPRNSRIFKKLENGDDELAKLLDHGKYVQAHQLIKELIEMTEKFVGQADRATAALLGSYVFAMTQNENYRKALSRKPDEVSRFKNLLQKFESVVSLTYGTDHPFCKKFVSRIHSLRAEYGLNRD